MIDFDYSVGELKEFRAPSFTKLAVQAVRRVRAVESIVLFFYQIL